MSIKGHQATREALRDYLALIEWAEDQSTIGSDQIEEMYELHQNALDKLDEE